MHNVLAVAHVTLKDALRKKVLFTILFFALVLVAVSGFLPWVNPEDQVRQMSKLCLGGIGFFGMIVAIFLAAPNLPDDIAKKTIFTVMTKPARRRHILAGKILGLAYVLAIILVVMGVISYTYISFWAWRLGPDPSGFPRLQGHKHIYADSIDLDGLTLDVSPAMVESERAITGGFNRLTFAFSGLDKERFRSDSVFAEVTLFCHAFSYDRASGEGTAGLEVKNPTTGQTETIIFGGETLRPKALGFSKSLIGADGRLEIAVLTRLKTGNYSAMAKSVAVLSQPSTYAINFLKALALMFIQYMVLVFIAIAGSTFLTSTVSTISALFIYFTGSLTEILRTQALALGTKADLFTMAQHSHDHTHHAIPFGHLVVNYLMRYFYLGISTVFPNLSSLNPTGAISRGEYISSSVLLGGLSYGIVFATASFLIAWAVFSKKVVA